MNLSEAIIEAQQRVQTVLKLGLSDALEESNTRFSLTNDRTLRFPHRILWNELPDAKGSIETGLPHVYLRWTGSTNPRVDLLGVEDNNLTLTASIILVGRGRSASDLSQRATLYANSLSDVLLNGLRKGLNVTEGREDWGIWRIALESTASPSVNVFDDLFVCRCDVVFDLSMRYRRNTQTTSLPELPLVESNMPLAAATPLEINGIIVPPFVGQTNIPFGSVWSIPVGSRVWIGQHIVSPCGGAAEWNEIVGSTYTFGQAGPFTIVALLANELTVTYRVEVEEAQV